MKSTVHTKQIPWETLIKSSREGIKGILLHWKRHQKIEDFVLTWPTEALTAESGEKINGACTFLFDTEDKSQRHKDIIKMVELTSPYAVFVVEHTPEAITAILESMSGTISWDIPIMQSADVKVLGIPEEKTNAKRIGVLYRPRNLLN